MMKIDADSSRNKQCPCGSGLRYKHCHGSLINESSPATSSEIEFPYPPNEIDRFLDVLSSGLYELDHSFDDTGDSFMSFVQQRIEDSKMDIDYFFICIGNLLAIRQALKDEFGNGTTNIEGSAELITRCYAAFSNINMQIQAYQRIVINDLLIDGFVKLESIDIENLRWFGVNYADELESRLRGSLTDKKLLLEVGREFLRANHDYIISKFAHLS